MSTSIIWSIVIRRELSSLDFLLFLLTGDKMMLHFGHFSNTGLYVRFQPEPVIVSCELQVFIKLIMALSGICSFSYKYWAVFCMYFWVLEQSNLWTSQCSSYQRKECKKAKQLRNRCTWQFREQYETGVVQNLHWPPAVLKAWLQKLHVWSTALSGSSSPLWKWKRPTSASCRHFIFIFPFLLVFTLTRLHCELKMTHGELWIFEPKSYLKPQLSPWSIYTCCHPKGQVALLWDLTTYAHWFNL